MTTDEFTQQIYLFVDQTPQEIVERVCQVCESVEDWSKVIQILNTTLYSARTNQQIFNIISIARHLKYSPTQIALVLRTGKGISESYKTHQRIELVWTGPEMAPFSLRRTDEAILEMINGAKDSLMIVSFVIFKVKRLFEALEEALSRGVKVQLFLETDNMKVMGGSETVLHSLPSQVKVYIWSDKHRLRNAMGQYGTLHAKIAIADYSTLLVSSANFTEYALSLNMELGLMVKGGSLPRQASQLLEDMLVKGVFVENN